MSDVLKPKGRVIPALWMVVRNSYLSPHLLDEACSGLVYSQGSNVVPLWVVYIIISTQKVDSNQKGSAEKLWVSSALHIFRRLTPKGQS